MTSDYVQWWKGGAFERRQIRTGNDAQPTFDFIPVIDLKDMDSPSLPARQAVAKEIGKICHDVGFFYAKNHGVPQSVIDHAFKMSAKFYQQPLEVKMEEYIHKRGNLRGYEPSFSSKLDMDEKSRKGDLNEGFLFGFDPTDGKFKAANPPRTDMAQLNYWPNVEFGQAFTDYYNHLYDFSLKLLRIFALALDVEENYFDKMLNSIPGAFCRPLFYPDQAPKKDMADPGLAAHTDFSTFTVMAQSGGDGLEVLNKNGVWIPAADIPNTFVVNVGDALELITNRKLESTVHRVVNRTGKERYTIPFFFGFAGDAMLDVVENCRTNGEAYKDGKLTMLQFVQQRLSAPGYHTNDEDEHQGVDYGNGKAEIII